MQPKRDLSYTWLSAMPWFTAAALSTGGLYVGLRVLRETNAESLSWGCIVLTLCILLCVYTVYRAASCTARRTHWQSLFASLDARAPEFFLIVALPLGLLFATLTPPFQVADEFQQFYRAVHVSRARAVGYVASEGQLGGQIDTGVRDFAGLFADLPFNFDAKLHQRQMRDAAAVRWSHKRDFVAFTTMGIYPPTLFAPQALAIRLAKTADATPMQSLYVARIANLCVALAIIYVALRLCSRGRALLAGIMLLPMSLTEMASASQEAGLLAVTALLVGLISSLYGGRGTRRTLWGAAACILVLATSRPPLIGLVPLLSLSAWRNEPVSARWRDCVTATGIVVGMYLAWLAYALSVKQPLIANAPASALEQLQFLFSSFGTFWLVVQNTYHFALPQYWNQFLGVLGWLDTPLPKAVYQTCTLALAAAIGCLLLRPHVLAWRDRLLVALAIFGAFTLTHVAIYLNWTPAHSDIVLGVQGRYLTTVAALLTFLIPGLLSRFHFLHSLLHGAALTASLAAILSTPYTLLVRYYFAQ